MFRNNVDLIASMYGPEPQEIQRIRSTCPENLQKMQMSYSECRILSLLLKMIAANKVLELGTLVGCSTAWIAHSLSGENAKVISIERSQKHYEIAKQNIANAGLGDKVECILFDALSVLRQYSESQEIMFDVIFIDAKKVEYVEYLMLAKNCLRKGGLIIADNTLMISENMPEISSTMRTFQKIIENDFELISAILPTIAGMTIAVKI